MADFRRALPAGSQRASTTISAALLFTRYGQNGGNPSTTTAEPSEFASAGDTGPVAIITNEPTCQGYMAINNSIANVGANGWGAQRSSPGPVSSWTPGQRSQVEAVASAMTNAADQGVPLIKQTPHRVVRELNERRLHTRAREPSTLADPGNAQNPQRFIATASEICTNWMDREERFTNATTDWANLDTGIKGNQWTSEQRNLQQAAVAELASWENDMEATGEASGNSVSKDFALAAALYLRAYIPLGDKYIEADAWLTYTAFRISNTISGACHAVGASSGRRSLALATAHSGQIRSPAMGTPVSAEPRPAVGTKFLPAKPISRLMRCALTILT